MVSGTIFDERPDARRRRRVEAFYVSVSHFDALSVGLNCAVGVDQMRPARREPGADRAARRSAATPTPACPTASAASGRHGADGRRMLGEFARNGWVNIVGGCCGTTPEWIARHRPRRSRASRRAACPTCPAGRTTAATKSLVVRPETNFVMVGERTNITGSRKFARLIKEGNYEAAIAVAREQVEGGANILDVNMDADLIDGEEAMTRFLNLLADEPDIASVPIMIDSSKWEIIEAGLKCVQGKGIVNSISLKEGEEKFLEQARLVRRYGAAVVVMAFDEEGQAVTADRKVAICERAYKLLTEEVGFDPADIIFDTNILTVGTGMEEHNNYAVEFFEAVRELKQLFPQAKTSRRRQQRLVLLPRQRGGARGDERGLPLPRDPRRPRHGHRQRRPAPGLRGDPQGPARARRGRRCSTAGPTPPTG